MGEFRALIIFTCLTAMSTTIMISTTQAAKNLRLINMNPNFAPWPNNVVPFYIDPSYTPEEQSQIRTAMFRVMSEVKMCVKFLEVPENAPQFKVKITPSKSPETPEGKCYTYPGKYVKGDPNGKQEQNLVLARGPDGCFDGSLHSLMKYFALVLGKRNEHQRPNRDQYIKVNVANIQEEMTMAYRPYDTSETFSTCNYDYCSITHNQPDDFAKQGLASFTVSQAPFFIPKLDHLSTCDCQDLMSLYGCESSQCTKVDCASMQQPLPGNNQSNSAVPATIASGGGGFGGGDISGPGSMGGNNGFIGLEGGVPPVGPGSFPVQRPTPFPGSGPGIILPAVQPSDMVTAPPSILSATTVSSVGSIAATLSPMGAQGTMICYNLPPSGGASSLSVTTSIVPQSGGPSINGVPSGQPTTVAKSAGLDPMPPIPDGASGSATEASSQAGGAGMTCSITTSGSIPPAGPVASGRPRRREHQAKTLRTINNDPNFLKWPGKTVYYYIDPAYSEADKALIKQAMQRVSDDLNSCIKFQETTPDDPLYKIKITPTTDLPAGMPQTCHSYPGAYKGFLSQGKKEQSLILTHGKDGCFDGTLHGLMKFFAVILGKRNEHQRPDRDQYITVNQANIRPGMEMAYQKYTTEVSSICPYDYCSITHNKIDDYTALPGSPVFNVTNAPYFIPRVDQLSECDCKQISAIYECPIDKCAKLNCAGLAGSKPGMSGSSGSTVNGVISQTIGPAGLGGIFNPGTAPSIINSNPATGGVIPAGTRFPNQPMNLHGGMTTQNMPGMLPILNTALPFPAVTAAPFAQSLPTTVFPAFAGAASMICYMIPVTNVPTIFTANINLGGFTIPANPATTPNPIGVGASTPGASITTMSPATVTCSPTGLSQPITPPMGQGPSGGPSGGSSQGSTVPGSATTVPGGFSGQPAGVTTPSSVSAAGSTVAGASSGQADSSTAAGSSAGSIAAGGMTSPSSASSGSSAGGSSGGPTTPSGGKSSPSDGSSTAAGSSAGSTAAGGMTSPSSASSGSSAGGSSGGPTTPSSGKSSPSDGSSTAAGSSAGSTAAGGMTSPSSASSGSSAGGSSGGPTTPSGGKSSPSDGSSTAAGSSAGSTAAGGMTSPSSASSGSSAGGSSGGPTTPSGGKSSPSDGSSTAAGSSAGSTAAGGMTSPSSASSGSSAGGSSGGPTTPSSENSSPSDGTSKASSAAGDSTSADSSKGSTSAGESSTGSTTAASSGASDSKETTVAGGADGTTKAGDASTDKPSDSTTPASGASTTGGDSSTASSGGSTKASDSSGGGDSAVTKAGDATTGKSDDSTAKPNDSSSGSDKPSETSAGTDATKADVKDEPLLMTLPALETTKNGVTSAASTATSVAITTTPAIASSTSQPEPEPPADIEEKADSAAPTTLKPEGSTTGSAATTMKSDAPVDSQSTRTPSGASDGGKEDVVPQKPSSPNAANGGPQEITGTVAVTTASSAGTLAPTETRATPSEVTISLIPPDFGTAGTPTTQSPSSVGSSDSSMHAVPIGVSTQSGPIGTAPPAVVFGSQTAHFDEPQVEYLSRNKS